jgi:hypothetical protein
MPPGSFDLTVSLIKKPQVLGKVIVNRTNAHSFLMSGVLGILASQEAGYWVDETSYQVADNEMNCNPAKLSRASRSRGVSPVDIFPSGLLVSSANICCPTHSFKTSLGSSAIYKLRVSTCWSIRDTDKGRNGADGQDWRWDSCF